MTTPEVRKPLEEATFRSEFEPLVLAMQEAEAEERECLKALSICADAKEDERLNEKLDGARRDAVQAHQTMVEVVLSYHESDVKAALGFAGKIFREVYATEEAGQPVISTMAPQSLRPIGITKLLEVDHDVYQELARRRESAPETATAAPTAVDERLALTKTELTAATAETPENLREFEQNLKELAAAYNAACEANDETEKGVVFERICQLGAEQILAMNEDPTAKDKLQAVIMKLDIRGPKESLYTEMLLHGLGSSFRELGSIGTAEAEVRNIPFYPDQFRDDFQMMLFAIKDFTDRAANTGNQQFAADAEWRHRQMAIRVSKLHPVHQRRALQVAEECFAQFEKELTTGPQALRKAGLRSYLKFDREVRRQMMNERTNEALRRTDIL
jgi:hypothetical protein